MLNIIERIVQGEGRLEDIDRLQSLGETIIAGALCGLGTSAPNPVISSIRYFRDEWEAHIKEKRCPAMVCNNLIHYEILSNRCIACHRCLWACPSKAITGFTLEAPIIDDNKCTRCGTCLTVCPARVSPIIKLPGREKSVAGSQAVRQEVLVHG